MAGRSASRPRPGVRPRPGAYRVGSIAPAHLGVASAIWWVPVRSGASLWSAKHQREEASAKTYTSTDAAATKAADEVIIAIFEPGSDTCSLSLELPLNSSAGTYKVGNAIDDDPVISALYATLSSCSSAATEGDWESTDGTITITESGTTWSGTFDVNIARRLSPTDVSRVTGSFSGLKLR